MVEDFTPAWRGGMGEPLVLLHGFTDTWRTWDLVLPALAEHHDVLAPTLPGHAGGPPFAGAVTADAMVDAVAALLDDAGLDAPHVAGNSLGAYIALRLAERGCARSVVAFAPAGGWAPGDESWRELLALQQQMQSAAKAMAARADAAVATPDGRRRATRLITTNFEHIPAELLAHQIVGVARCAAATPLIEHALAGGWPLDATRITCPVRVVWGTADRLLPWPSVAARYRDEWLPHADWVELDGAGHCPQLDVPLEAAQLVLGFTR